MLEIKYIGHACVLLSSQSERVLVDPWWNTVLNDGTMNAVPAPVALSSEEIESLTAIHISHIHSDHFCESTLTGLSKETPVVIAKRKDGVLAARVKALGFEKVIEVEPGPRGYVLGDLRLSVFLPGAGYPYDSSLVVTCAGHSYLFDNDARFAADHYFLLGQYFKTFEAAFVGYADIYPFPLMYDFSECRDFVAKDMNETMLAHSREQSWRRVESVCEYIRPKWVCPYAASIRFRHPELLHFNRMFFPRDGILERNLYGAKPVGLLHGDVVAPGETPAFASEQFQEPVIVPLAPRVEDDQLINEVGQNAEAFRQKLRELLRQTSVAWSSKMTISIEVRNLSKTVVRFGYLFDGGKVSDLELPDSECDLSIQYAPEVAWKILFKNWKFSQAHYSYKASTVVRRIVAGQIAVHRWS